MSAERDWALDQLASVVTSVSNDYGATLERVNRDDSEILEGGIRTRKGELKEAAYVGATLADREPEPLGFEYDHELETVVAVRVEGLHTDEWGHIDPGGTDGVPWDVLVRRIKRALLAERTYPAVGAPDTDYYSLLITNVAPDSASHRDYYREDFDVVLQGDETLP